MRTSHLPGRHDRRSAKSTSARSRRAKSAAVAGVLIAPTLVLPASFMNVSMSRNHASRRRRSPVTRMAPAAPTSLGTLAVSSQATACPLCTRARSGAEIPNWLSKRSFDHAAGFWLAACGACRARIGTTAANAARPRTIAVRVTKACEMIMCPILSPRQRRVARAGPGQPMRDRCRSLYGNPTICLASFVSSMMCSPVPLRSSA